MYDGVELGAVEPLVALSCFQPIVVSIAFILSYTAFLDGAVVVTQSQLAA